MKIRTCLARLFARVYPSPADRVRSPSRVLSGRITGHGVPMRSFLKPCVISSVFATAALLLSGPAGGVVGMIVMAVTGVAVTAAAGSLWRAVSAGVFIIVHHSLRRL